MLSIRSGFRTRRQGVAGDFGEASSTTPSHGGRGTSAGSGLAHWPAVSSTHCDQCGRCVAPCGATPARVPCSAGLGAATFGLAGTVPRRGSPRWLGTAALAVDSQGGTGRSSPAVPATSVDARGRCGRALASGGGWIRLYGVHRGLWPLGPGYPGASWVGTGAQPAPDSRGLSVPRGGCTGGGV
jgi:hypothetical protein